MDGTGPAGPTAEQRTTDNSTHQFLRQPVVLGREGLLLRRRLPPLRGRLRRSAAPGTSSAVLVLQVVLGSRSAASSSSRTLRRLLLRRSVSSLLLPPAPPSGESLGLSHGGCGRVWAGVTDGNGIHGRSFVSKSSERVHPKRGDW